MSGCALGLRRSQCVWLTLCWALVACGSGGSRPNGAPSSLAAERSVELEATSAADTFQCGLLTVPISGTVPGDAQTLPNQLEANCFAWWEFISLNWPGDGKAFGVPGDTSAVAWETYAPLSQVFLPRGVAPPPFGTQPAPPQRCADLVAREGANKVNVLREVSKFSAEFSDGDDAEAFPGDAPAWLGTQSGTNVWYEVRLNEDEFDTIVANGWYSAAGQAKTIASGKPVLLPQGVYQGVTGAIELKAAWMEVTNPADPKWRRYKLSEAIIVDSNDDTCRYVSVALAGLHIIHKTASQPTWIWATFEHVDNAPNQHDVEAGSVSSGTAYNFYSAKCQEQQVDVDNAVCLPKEGRSPVAVPCTPNTPPPYYLGRSCPKPVPIQVARALPLDANAVQANDYVHQALGRYAPDNVFLNYQLVNVIWSTNPVEDPSVPVHVPTPIRGMNPPKKVANTTLETYAQNKTCTDCHQNATTATVSGMPDSKFSSDFSFALSAAQ